MTVRQGLVRLYPAAFRDRWGASMASDDGWDRAADHEPGRRTAGTAAGWRTWVSLLAGAADIWLHPVIWPVDRRAQRRERAAVLALAVAALVGLLGHAAGELGVPLRTAPGGAWIARASAVLLLLGLVLVAPLPRPTRAAATALLGRAVRRLVPPLVAVVAFVAVAHRYGPVIAASPWRLVAVAGWWAALAAVGVQACRVLAGLGGTAVRPPRPRRLRLGLWGLTAASVLAGSNELASAIARQGVDGIGFAAGAVLLAAAWALAATLRDLHSVAAD
ncbi:hypothetical protein [Streptacidiphilus fuscans]|uniref:Uncharacterized protein n=1 Tax=Streptacidiphilus fuscans TaxID=2789292 RepID=A0A931FDU9_9ACTN|nr:hypothetical protein [Streptacidiphilus fuscans]MBF9069948.1 hypothetical protein [Streptacidiphilus fuscans]